jgi:DNA-binding transcriptional ArsR family regulator
VDRRKKPGRKTEKRAAPRQSIALLDVTALEQASRLFKAMGEVSRLRLLTLLSKGEVCVTELAEEEGETISTISQRLRVLRNENIVLRRRRGKHINYVLADQHIMDLVFNALAHAAEVSANDNHDRSEPKSVVSDRSPR